MTSNPSQSLRRMLLPGVALLAATFSNPALAHRSHLSITTLSARPENVSGGDVLVRIDVPRHAALSDVRVSLNGTDVTGVFLPDSGGNALVGLVRGLRSGDSVLTAETKRTHPSLNARLALRNSPLYGPVFSGPHQRPWICETVSSGLGDDTLPELFAGLLQRDSQGQKGRRPLGLRQVFPASQAIAQVLLDVGAFLGRHRT